MTQYKFTALLQIGRRHRSLFASSQSTEESPVGNTFLRDLLSVQPVLPPAVHLGPELIASRR
jgi:hypothetical protein